MNSPSVSRPATSNFRWIICALLFFSTTVNYMDRQVISYLKEFFCRPAHQPGDSQMFSAGDFIDLSALANKLKQSPSTFNRDEAIPPAAYWVTGKAPKSFDSRYWGYVYDYQVIGRAYAIF